ncbi:MULTISPECIES: Rieske (2Fe-2S) protein [Salinibaculum]|uniref:Rieske (2Fe-2S) protein n=1 Tax=Salinibaculum TaxID=2732368 RepID=UPI0030D34744
MSEHKPDAPQETSLHHVAPESEIPEGERRIIEIDGREIAVFNIDGTYHAVLNYCTHQSGPVCEGMVHGIMALDDENELTYTEDEYLSCPWHGWTFDIETGKHTGGTKHRLVKYETEVKDGDVYLVRGN